MVASSDGCEECFSTWWFAGRDLHDSFFWFVFFLFYWGLSLKAISIWFEASTTGMVWEISYYYFGFHLHVEPIWLLSLLLQDWYWDRSTSCVCRWYCDYMIWFPVDWAALTATQIFISYERSWSATVFSWSWGPTLSNWHTFTST